MENAKVNIESFYDNPLKRKGFEEEHDRLDAGHFDEAAKRFLKEKGERELIVDLNERMPPRHRAFWRELSDVTGKRVLDVGCGYGYSACRMAMLGADVVAIDVSNGMCDLSKKAAELNGVEIDVRNISALDTGLPEESIDIIAGQVSVHHLPLHSAAPELVRVLKTGGKAVFLEPVHGSKTALKIRGKLPVKCHESPGGGALRREEIAALGELFGRVEIVHYNILERLGRFGFLRWALPVFYLFDELLLSLPFTSRLAAQALIILTKTNDNLREK